ncbi:MAG: deoxyribonuclease IV [Candidatus Rokubacteria bacterium]|nr:deoxyribonuclease IV [Candidatus Rokubacteria bacterium]
MDRKPEFVGAQQVDEAMSPNTRPHRPRPSAGVLPRPPDDLLGVHASIAGGLYRALERGAELGCSAVQIFLKNQRQWAAPSLTQADVSAFRAAWRRSRIRSVFAHASYLINLATPGAAQWAQAVTAFTDELERAEALGLACVVIHPGSHAGEGTEAGLARVTAALDEVTRRTAGYRVRIALENTAGAGHTLGRTFRELAALLDRAARPARVGICIDTCHLFASGYDLRRDTGWDDALAECLECVGRRRVLAFHVNDSRAPLGSGLDRHEHIGRGALGLRPFRRLLTDPRFARVPKVLETPKEPEPIADRRNLATLRRLRRLGVPDPLRQR